MKDSSQAMSESAPGDGAAVRPTDSWRENPGPVQIKICGLTDVGDARAALDSGADCLGFVLVPQSPRCISRMALLRLLDRLGTSACAVAVVMNDAPATVRQLAIDAALRAVQLHGREEAADYADFPVPVWRALRTENGAAWPDPMSWPAQRFVLDATVPGKLPGGTGVLADWDLAAQLARRLPLMLAGGLRADNVADAVRRVRPLGVDTASGIERVPGRKDFGAMRAFVRAVRETEESL